MNKRNEIKTGYIQTEIERIYKEWEEVKFKEVFSYIKGKKPAELIDEYKGNYLPYLSTEYLRENKATKFARVSEDVISINKGDLILLWDGSNAGEFFIGKEGILSSTMVKLQLKKENINSVFMFYLLKIKEYYLSGLTRGTGVPHVDKNVLENLTLLLPPLPEQQKIAEILSTVDSAIEKVNQAIEKTQRLKKGLMQELLTKGIGHKEFKDTEIGRIPKEWEVVRLKESKEIDLIMGQSPPGKSYNKKGEGFPFIQGKAEFGNMYPSPILWTTQPTKIAEEGDILISVRAPVGDVNICPYRLCIGRGLAAIRIKEGSNIFYFYWFQKEKQRIENIGKGSTFEAITKGELSNIFIPFPPLPEQQKIAEILSTVDKRLVLLRNKKEKMERVKKGLMNDLLTGRKQVKGSKRSRELEGLESWRE